MASTAARDVYTRPAAGNESGRGIERPAARTCPFDHDERFVQPLVKLRLRERALDERRDHRLASDLDRKPASRLPIDRRLDRPGADRHPGRNRQPPIAPEPPRLGDILDRRRGTKASIRAPPLRDEFVRAGHPVPFEHHDGLTIVIAAEDRSLLAQHKRPVGLPASGTSGNLEHVNRCWLDAGRCLHGGDRGLKTHQACDQE